jgi:hypothetical protein
VLALTDEALGLVVIAATAISPEERSAWLADVASRLDPSPAPSRNAIYTRRWRARQRNGRCLLKIEVDEVALIVGLVDNGFLSPALADDPVAVNRAAAKALEHLVGETSHPDNEISARVKIGLLTTALEKAHARSRGAHKSRSGR